MSKTTEWQQRIAEWRASGLSAKAFCTGRDFAESTLHAWASRLRANPPPPESPTIHFNRVVRANTTPTERRIIVELLDARIVIEPGFDPSTLASILATIQRTKGAP